MTLNMDRSLMEGYLRARGIATWPTTSECRLNTDLVSWMASRLGETEVAVGYKLGLFAAAEDLLDDAAELAEHEDDGAAEILADHLVIRAEAMLAAVGVKAPRWRANREVEHE